MYLDDDNDLEYVRVPASQLDILKCSKFEENQPTYFHFHVCKALKGTGSKINTLNARI